MVSVVGSRRGGCGDPHLVLTRRSGAGSAVRMGTRRIGEEGVTSPDFATSHGAVARRALVGADDEGPVLDAVVDELEHRGFSVRRVPPGAWPEVARRVGEAVAAGEADLGVLACWTGTGTSIMANKVPGVRAALCWEPWIAEGARRWNDANLLVLSLIRTDPAVAREIVAAWLAIEAPDPDEVPHIAQIAAYERGRVAP